MQEGRHYRYYVLAALTTGGVLNIADRLILSILLEDIKKAFTLSDTQIGLITGLAFTAFYIICGIPIAWLADRKNRKTIIALSIATWSLMTALCGAAIGFWTLFFARMGVGVGESGSGPAGLSLLADYFRRHELGRAMGFNALGSTIGTAVGLMVGGYFAHLLGWRMAFVMLGVPGIIFALIVYLTVKEPERGRYHPGAVVTPKAESLRDGLQSWLTTIASLLKNKLYVAVTLAYAFMIVIGYGFATWLASIMLRNFPVSTADVGFYLGLAFLLGGIPGPLLGGFLTDYLVKLNPKWRAWLPALATLLCLPVYYLCLTSTSFWGFLGLFACGYLIFLIAQPPTISLLQLAVKPDERAMAVAVAMLFNNLIGQALGGFLIGLTSTNLMASLGVHALSVAVMVVSVGFGLPGVLLFLWTGRLIKADFDAGHTDQRQTPSK
jgi:predicted MFS family arabinose efflux permease